MESFPLVTNRSVLIPRPQVNVVMDEEDGRATNSGVGGNFRNAEEGDFAGAEMEVHKLNLKKKGGSSSSSSRISNLKQLKIQKEDTLLTLEMKFEKETTKLQDEIEDLKTKIEGAAEGDEKAKIDWQSQLSICLVKLRRLKRDYDSDKKWLDRALEMEKKKLDAENEEEQQVEDLDDGKLQFVNEWAKSTGEATVVPHPHQERFQQKYPHHMEQHQHQHENPVPARRNQQLPRHGYNPNIGHHHDNQWQDGIQHHQPRQQVQTGNVVADLTAAFKEAFMEVKGERQWEPKDLPVFNGRAEDWPIFCNEFYRTTPKGMVNTSQNAIRLRKALKGSAMDSVIGLLNEPDNINKIMRILEQRFGRKELVIKALITKAEECKSPDINKPETFVSYGTTVQHLVETVKSLQEERYLNDMTLLDKLVGKLPAQYAFEWLSWIRGKPDEIGNLGSFGQWVESKLDLSVCLVTPTIKDKEDTFKKNAKAIRGSAKVNTVASEEQTSIKKKDKCHFCDMTNHRLDKCYRFQKENLESKTKVVRDNRLCFRCLRGGHMKKDCASQQICGVNECSGEHHPLLHYDGKKNLAKDKVKRFEKVGSEPSYEFDYDKKPADTTTTTNIGAMQTKNSKPMSIVRIRVKGPAGVRKVYALLDSGADTTIIESDLAKSLGITGRIIKHQCHVLQSGVINSTASVVKFDVAGAYKNAKYYSIQDAVTIDRMGLSPYSQNAALAKANWTYLRKARLDSFTNVVPQVIIGEDNPFVTAHRELLQRKEDEPMAKRTLLGWVMAGRKLQDEAEDSHINVINVGNEHLDNLLRSSFSLDSYGIYTQDTVGSVEDRRALEILNSTVKKVKDHWECGLLWRDQNVKLPESRNEAVSRLISNERRMKRDPVFGEMYHKKMDEYIQKDYIRELSPSEVQVKTDKTLYIPHFGVFNVHKPGKLRLVFDAACKNGGVSLNENLLTGPDLIRLLPTVLMNFRIHNYAINGDIEDMFHRVAVCQRDQDSQRFVWRDLRAEKPIIKDYAMKVLIFGACSSPSSAIFVKNKNADDFLQTYPEAVRAIKEDFYCDDYLGGAQTVKEAIKLRQQVSEIHEAGNFKIKKWLSNSSDVISSIPEDERAVGVKVFGDKTEIPTERVLGLWYNPEEDVLTFSANFKKVDPTLLEGRRPTKREMCGLIMSVFDPLGFIGNFKIKGIILFQRTWRNNVDWDDEIPDPIYDEWKVWVSRLKETENVKVPRVYAFDIHLATNISLHTLTDASEEATACVCYLRIVIGGYVVLVFVCAKIKVAPIKKLTIPRLELIAAVMGVCLSNTIIEELRLPIKKKYFWTDSITVLKWIRTETLRYKEFVANRVNRIHLLSNVKDWKWVPTKLNISDQGTRLASPIELSSSSSWLTGPEFLLQDPSEWPVEKATEKEDDDDEVRKSAVHTLHLHGFS